MFPDLPLPPQPIVTRCGTWIEAAVYYSDNFTQIKDFLSQFDSSEAKSIRKAKSVIDQTTLKRELVFIKSNFSCLTSKITKLQTTKLPLIESIETFESMRENLPQLRGKPLYLKKFDQVVARNKGFIHMKTIAIILSTGKTTQSNSIIDELTPDELNAFRFAPITSCDVERTFSMYKNVLSDNRRSLLFENIKKYVVIVCNQLES